MVSSWEFSPSLYVLFPVAKTKVLFISEVPSVRQVTTVQSLQSILEESTLE